MRKPGYAWFLLRECHLWDKWNHSKEPQRAWAQTQWGSGVGGGLPGVRWIGKGVGMYLVTVGGQVPRRGSHPDARGQAQSPHRGWARQGTKPCQAPLRVRIPGADGLNPAPCVA